LNDKKSTANSNNLQVVQNTITKRQSYDNTQNENRMVKMPFQLPLKIKGLIILHNFKTLLHKSKKVIDVFFRSLFLHYDTKELQFTLESEV
jgi:hypothetical protein